MPPGAVVSIIPALHGGAGQVAVDVVRALRGRPQLVLCADTGTFAGQGLEEAMAAEGAAIDVVGSDAEVVERIALARPSAVVDHCGPYFFANGPPRISGERWIAIAHGALSLPYGYDAYVVISAFTAQYHRHLPPDRVHWIPNGVDLVRFRPRRRSGTGPVRIAALSRLDPGKLPRQLLSYLPHLPSLGASLAIAGRGARRAELEPAIRARGLAGSIRFVGVVAPARIPAFLAGADIGLHLTETEQEACSLAVLEMLASGLPIVGQPRGCVPELVIDGENGYLRDDPAEIAECLVALIRSPDLRARMGARSRRLARGYGMARYRQAIRRLVLRDAPAPTPKPRRSIEPQDISLAGWTPALTYLICTTRRSGGTLLCEALASTGVAGFPDESFVAAFDRSLEEDDHDEFCRRLLRRVEARTTPNGVFGAKIFVEDLERLIARLGSPAAGKAPFELLTSRLPRLRLIYLSRRDRLRQAISLVRAEQSGRWSHNDRPVARVRLDRARIRRALGSIAADTAKWDAFFAAWPAAPIRVHYEDLAARYEATALAVVRQLGIETVAPIVFAPRRLVRQADALTERWVRRMRGDRDARAGRAPSP
jgi:LPS sulfotransferase NodH/glycosyltransferase involved in cell wall biosynthesis